jgi:hypothetical protein
MYQDDRSEASGVPRSRAAFALPFRHPVSVPHAPFARLPADDVQHFMRALGIPTTDALRQVNHRAIIAWERMQREQEGAAASTLRRRLAPCPACSSIW